ncbi:MAG: UDP-N-acetylmuramoyl-L-alanyl-D-glutamate--2,6-diaminopimelate ligase [Holosporales bacterium]|jgi:UDP-N-acetylmuramoyl-L-alanyl-D-glutamate--2,6-diaminopimelate ligase|nr:UDP-N-acetylmuramoyl-L-alanyl-D-glutamate--2,6-diaminopimelate ligase [Holosporales bacterium]
MLSVAVTGTNGKSSVVHFLRQIWNYADFECASLGTVGLFVGNHQIKSDELDIPNLTTPGIESFHKVINFLLNKEITHFAFEASSHGLTQGRIPQIMLSAAAFTNFGHDHLDYHKTEDCYFESKLILFKDILKNDKLAVVYGDHSQIYENVYKYNQNIMTFGFNKNNSIRAQNIQQFPSYIKFDLVIKDKLTRNIKIKIFGEFQILNIMCAIALAHACGLAFDVIINTLHKITGLEGRMEMVATHNNGFIYVDYAHTADGFKQILETFKKFCRGKLICVFGCGGNRDTSKRYLIGKAAAEIADIAIVTNDNPRNEDPTIIRKEILIGCPNGIEISNRKEAIKYAIESITPNDFVAILGKGHETTQIYKDKIINHNDKEEVLKYCRS